MIKKLFVSKSNIVSIQFFRYILVGGLAFLIDFSIFLLLVEYFNIYYLVANTFAFSAGLIVNYILSIIWVFDKRKLSSKKTEFLIFLSIGLIGLLFNQLALYVSIEYLLLSIIISKCIATLLVFLWNFIARKIILF